MENIQIAKICGLCAGCNFAINLANDSCKKQPTALLKEIVHNKNINNSLKEKGIITLENIENIDKNLTIVIRAHGEPPETFDYLSRNDIKFLDGTCANVKAIHKLVEEKSNNDYKIAIIGKYGKGGKQIHPEVYGIAGYAKSEPIFIEDLEDVSKLCGLSNEKIFVVCQTTFNPLKFEILQEKITQICIQNNNELIIKNTICGAQRAIQKSTLELAQNSDIMIIVGGKHSSNTLELFENIKNVCLAIHIENIDDVWSELENNNFTISVNSKIGISAGASTDKQELFKLKENIENYLSKK